MVFGLALAFARVSHWRQKQPVQWVTSGQGCPWAVSDIEFRIFQTMRCRFQPERSVSNSASIPRQVKRIPHGQHVAGPEEQGERNLRSGVVQQKHHALLCWVLAVANSIELHWYLSLLCMTSRGLLCINNLSRSRPQLKHGLRRQEAPFHRCENACSAKCSSRHFQRNDALHVLPEWQLSSGPGEASDNCKGRMRALTD